MGSEDPNDFRSLDSEIVRLQKSTRTTVPAMLPLHDILRQKYRWYYNWHLVPGIRFIHTLILLVFIAFIGGVFYNFFISQRLPVFAASGNVNPDGAVTAQWTAVGGTIPGILTDASNATYISGDLSSGKTNEYLSMQDLTIGYQATTVQVNLRYNTAATSSIGVKIYDGTGETVCGTDLGPSVSIVDASRTCSSLTWSQTQVNNLQVRLTAKGSGATNVYENSATITYTIEISGTSNGAGTVRVAVQGVLQAQTGSIAGGNWTISGVLVNSGNIVTTWIDNVLDTSESSAVTEWDGSGNITGMVLNTNVLSIGSADNQTISANGFGAGYGCTQDEDIMFAASVDPVAVQGCANSYSDETLSILAGNTLNMEDYQLTTDNLTIAATGSLTQNPNFATWTLEGNLTNSGTITMNAGAGTINISGTWTNNNVFTAGGSTVVFNNTGAGQTLAGSAATAFNSLTLSNTNQTLTANTNFSVGVTLTVNANTTLSPTAGVVVSGAGTLTGSGTAQVKTNVANAFATQYTITNKTLTNLTVDYNGSSASGQTLTNTTYGSAGSGGLKISGTLNSGTQTATVGGVFTVPGGGTYAPGASTITMNASSSIVNSATMTFSALTIAGGGVTTTSNFTINGALTINGASNLTASGTSTITMATTGWSVTNGATLTLQNLTISETPTSQSGFSANVNGTLTVNANKTFAPSGGTITMNNAAWALSLGASASLTFSGLTIAATPSTQPTASFSISGALIVNNGITLSPTAGTITKTGSSITNNGGASSNLAFYDLAVAGTVTTSSNFTVKHSINVNSGSFTASAGTVTMNANTSIANSATLTFSGLTAAGTGVTTSSNFTVNGALTVNAASALTASGTSNITMATTGWGLVNSAAASSLVFINLTISETPTSQPNVSFYQNGTLTVSANKTFAPTGGTITMNNAAWAISLGASAGLTFQGLTIAATPSIQPTTSFSIAGALTVNASQTLAPTAGTITMTGGSIVNNNVLTFNNLTVTGTTTTSSNFSVTGTLNVSGGNLSPSAGTITLNNSSTITNSGTLVFNNVTLGGTVSSGSSFSVKANWTNDGTFNHSAGTVTLSGASGSTQIIGGSNGTTFQNLTATATAARTIQFAGNSTTVVSGTWTVTGNSYPAGLIALQSTDANNWTINPATANVSYADVSRSTNSGPAFCATFSNDGGSNNNWTISTTASCAPTAPDGVTISSIQTGQFTVGWNDNSGNETNFRVWISTSANDDCSLATFDASPSYTTGANITTQIANSLAINSRYCAKVTSKNSTNESAAAYSSPKYTLANPPITASHSAIATNSITWTWGKNSNPAWTEFYANDDSGINSGWVADASSWGASGGTKTANTQYTVTIKARNGDGVEAPEAPTVVQTSAYTAIEAPTTITAGLITPNSIVINLSDSLTNLAVGLSGIQYAETSGNPGSGGEAAFTGWPQTTSTTDVGLQGAISGVTGTTYSYKIKARNAEGAETSQSAGFDFTTTAGTQLLFQLPGETLDENGSHLLSYSDPNPGTVVAGAPFDLTIYAADGANYRDLAHTDTITLSSTDALAELPVAAAMTNGSITYNNVVLKTVGTQTLSGSGSAGSSHEVVVVPGSCSASVSTATASPTSLDTGETSTVTITLKDAFGNNLNGHTVSTGSDQPADDITFSGLTTDVNGLIYAYVTSNEAHTSTVTIGDTTLGSLCTLDDQPQITFNTPTPPSTPTPTPSPENTIAGSPTPTPPPPPGDEESPTAPTNLRATDIGETTIDLAWDASTDNVGVAGYELYNADTNIKIATTSNTFHSLSGLKDDTTYRFFVRAFDAAGNFSPNSNTLSVRTKKITGPPEEEIVAFLVMGNLPDKINAGQNFPKNVRVSAADAGGKIIHTYNKAIHFSSSDKNAQLGVDSKHMYTFTGADAGVHEFPGKDFVLNTGGTQKLTVSDYSTSTTAEIDVLTAPPVPSVVRDFFTNPQNMSKVNTGVITTTTAVLLIPLLINTAFSLGTLLPQLAYWFMQLLQLFGIRKRRKAWGVVFNSQSGQPISLAMVRIFDKQYNRVLEQAVSDNQGRYGFLVREGTFYIQASKSGFTFPPTEKSSSYYEKIYVGGDFNIAGKDQSVAFNIPMDPHTKPGFVVSLWILMVRLNRLLQKLRLPLLLIGLIFALIMILTAYNVLYLLSLAFYVLLGILEYLRTFKARPYGVVTDNYNHPLGIAIVRIYRKENNRLIETDVTDSLGRFRFLVAPGVYYLIAVKPGYVDFKSHLMYLQKEKTLVSTTIKLKKEEK